MMEHYSRESEEALSSDNPELLEIEKMSFPECRQAIVDALSLPSGVATMCQIIINESLEEALATAINPHDREALLVTAHMVKWRMLGGADESLPLGLVAGIKSGKQVVQYDSRLGINASCVRDALVNLRGFGLGKVDEAAEGEIERMYQHAKPVLEKVVEQSQIYSLLQAMDGSHLAGGDRQPLNEYWRGVREAQLAHHVSLRLGLNPHRRIERFSEGDLELRRQLPRLDDETMPSENQTPDEPLGRLKKYFVQKLQAEVSDIGVIKGYGSKYDEKVLYVTNHNEPLLACEYFEPIADKISTEIKEQHPLVSYVSRKWLAEFVEVVLWADNNQLKFEEAARAAFEELWKYQLSDECLNFRQFFELYNYQNDLHGALMVDPDNLVDLGHFKKRVYPHSHHQRKGGSSEMVEINFPSDMPIGSVIRATPLAKGDHAHRLIQTVSASGEILRAVIGNEPLILQITNNEYLNSYPYIPGFKLVAKEGSIFGFELDQQGDPYASADVAISSDQREKLAAIYNSLGLGPLAQAIKADHELTVQGLAQAISGHSEYATRLSAETHSFPRYALAYDLQDFEPLVKNNKLHVQCTGAAAFLNRSLEKIFGMGCVSSVSGIKLSRYNLSYASSHAQSAFSNNGKVYILDATPKSSGTEVYYDYLFDSSNPKDYSHNRKPASIARPQLSINNTVFEKKDEALVVVTKEQKVQKVRESFESQIMTLTETDDKESAYGKISSLNLDDPFSVATYMVLRASYGDIDTVELNEGLRQLSNYSQLSEASRRELKLDNYDDGAIRLLQNTLEQLIYILDQD